MKLAKWYKALGIPDKPTLFTYSQQFNQEFSSTISILSRCPLLYLILYSSKWNKWNSPTLEALIYFELGCFLYNRGHVCLSTLMKILDHMSIEWKRILKNHKPLWYSTCIKVYCMRYFVQWGPHQYVFILYNSKSRAHFACNSSSLL